MIMVRLANAIFHQEILYVWMNTTELLGKIKISLHAILD